MSADQLDPKGLIREAYRIEGITASECRSIFLDWALGFPLGEDPKERIRGLLELYGREEDHPMTATLRAGLEQAPNARRRGGRRARVQD